jgi:hypothetical protein
MSHRIAVVIAIILAACIPTEPVRRQPPRLAAPVGQSGEAITIDSVTGDIPAWVWRPAGSPRAAVLLIPDRASGSEALVGVAERLVAAGAIVLVPDRRGRYAPRLTWSDERWRTARLATWLRREVPAAPLYLAGDGEGGTLALSHAVGDRDPVAGVAAAGPQLTLPDPLPLLALRSAGDSLWPMRGLGPIGRLWDEAAALDQPLVIAPAAGDEAIALDFAARTSSVDRTVAADADLAGWIVARLDGTATAATSPPPAASSPGLATSITAGLGVARVDGATDSGGALRLLVAHGRVGWAGAVSYYSDVCEAALMPLGLGARVGTAGQLALVGGVGLGCSETWLAPVEASAELPLGRHLRGLATAKVMWELDEERAGDLALGIDDVQLRVGLRFPGSRHLWQRVDVGAGLYLAATYRRFGNDDIVGFEVGYHLWSSR